MFTVFDSKITQKARSQGARPQSGNFGGAASQAHMLQKQTNTSLPLIVRCSGQVPHDTQAAASGSMMASLHNHCII